MQAEKVTASDVHFQAATRVMGALVRMLPADQRTARGQQHGEGSGTDEVSFNFTFAAALRAKRLPFKISARLCRTGAAHRSGA